MDMRVMIPSTLSKQTDAFIIKNPEKTTNTFTFTEESKAADELRMWQQRELADLKQFLKGYDMTSISTDELKVVGRRLYESNIIDASAFGIFTFGDGAFDANGKQTNTQVKFNAIALFNEKLDDYLDFVKSNPSVGRSQGIPEYIKGWWMLIAQLMRWRTSRTPRKMICRSKSVPDPDSETQIEVCQNLWHTLFIYGSATQAKSAVSYFLIPPVTPLSRKSGAVLAAHSKKNLF